MEEFLGKKNIRKVGRNTLTTLKNKWVYNYVA